MLTTSLNRLLRSDVRWNYYLYRGLHGPRKVNEYVEKAVYPPISSFKNEKERLRAKAKDAVLDMQTVEEKMYQINRPKYYGWWSYIIDPNYIPADSLEFSKFSTWTHVIDGMPEYYSNAALDAQAATILNEIGPVLEEVVRDQLCFRELGRTVSNDRVPYGERHAVSKNHLSPNHLERLRSQNLIKRIHEVIYSHLALSSQHLKEAVEDYESRNEAFWFRGGIQPDKSMLKKREGTKKMVDKKRKTMPDSVEEKTDDWVNQSYERALQIRHSAIVQLRHAEPLPAFVDRDDARCTNLQVPVFDYDPRSLGYRTKCQHGTNIPGFWPEEGNQLGLLSYHTRINDYNLRSAGGRDVLTDEMERAQDIAKGILTNFGWLMPQACYLGFSPLTELTFPLASQSVNTDGRDWSFFAYQLNTCDLSTNDTATHTHQNLVWTQTPTRLFSKIEDGKLVNFDPSALKTLIKMYLNEPSERSYDMTPHLGEVGRLVDFPDDYQRSRFMDLSRLQTANRQKGHAKPEMYLWEKILLVDHQQLINIGMNRRRRPWHFHKIDFLGKEHWHPEFVNTDEKTDRYIPKGMREPWTRKGTLNRRYNKYQPKIQVPLKNKIAMYEVPKTQYDGEKD